jgi:hypothetical protein
MKRKMLIVMALGFIGFIAANARADAKWDVNDSDEKSVFLFRKGAVVPYRIPRINKETIENSTCHCYGYASVNGSRTAVNNKLSTIRAEFCAKWVRAISKNATIYTVGNGDTAKFGRSFSSNQRVELFCEKKLSKDASGHTSIISQETIPEMARFKYRDKDGNLIYLLSKSKVPSKCLSHMPRLTPFRVPFVVGFLVDGSGSMKDIWKKVRRSINSYSKKMNKNEFSVRYFVKEFCDELTPSKVWGPVEDATSLATDRLGKNEFGKCYENVSEQLKSFIEYIEGQMGSEFPTLIVVVTDEVNITHDLEEDLSSIQAKSNIRIHVSDGTPTSLCRKRKVSPSLSIYTPSCLATRQNDTVSWMTDKDPLGLVPGKGLPEIMIQVHAGLLDANGQWVCEE